MTRGEAVVSTVTPTATDLVGDAGGQHRTRPRREPGERSRDRAGPHETTGRAGRAVRTGAVRGQRAVL